MSYPSDPKERRTQTGHWLRELESPNKPLTNWEENFLESVREQFQNYGRLTDRQLEIVERIYAEKTA